VGYQKIKTDVKKPILPDDQFDSIFYTLCNFFNDYYFFEVSEKFLDFITNKSSIKYLIEQAKILSYKKEYDQVISLCNEIMQKEKNNYIACILRGNAFFFKQNIFDSEESYVKAIRCKPDRTERFDVKMLYRLGLVYVRRKTWADAKTVFLQILKESTQFGFAWRYLGLAYMRLGEYNLAEEALNEANLLDVDNPENWAYLTIFCILVGRKFQAYECLNELNKTKFENCELWEEIGDLFERIGEYQIAADVYNKIIKIDPKFINIYIKLSKLYFNQFDSKRKESIEILRNCLKFAEDEKDKKRIADSIEQITNQVGLQDSQFLDKSLEKNVGNMNMNTDQTDIFSDLNNNQNNQIVDDN
jgi:tetratricopeptide (TPR) repeat protein